MLRRPRTWCGIALCAAGIALARLAPPAMNTVDLANAAYLVGIILSLGGLAVVASAMQIVSVKVVTCPGCFLINAAETASCMRCQAPLGENS